VLNGCLGRKQPSQVREVGPARWSGLPTRAAWVSQKKLARNASSTAAKLKPQLKRGMASRVGGLLGWLQACHSKRLL